MATYNWHHNIWTGDYILRVCDNQRIVRISEGCYVAEDWGDYSLAYPIRHPVRGTLTASLVDLNKGLCDLRR